MAGACRLGFGVEEEEDETARLPVVVGVAVAVPAIVGVVVPLAVAAGPAECWARISSSWSSAREVSSVSSAVWEQHCRLKSSSPPVEAAAAESVMEPAADFRLRAAANLARSWCSQLNSSTRSGWWTRKDE